MTATTNEGHVQGVPRRWLRLEGAAALVGGLAIYGALGGNWLFALPLLILPDLSMVGYLRDPRLGALTYNALHNWAVGPAVLGGGVLLSAVPLELAGAILIAHVGGDRLLGYGLKYPTSFGDTHLGHIGRRR
jgi:uncharacterized protein DUF4260